METNQQETDRRGLLKFAPCPKDGCRGTVRITVHSGRYLCNVCEKSYAASELRRPSSQADEFIEKKADEVAKRPTESRQHRSKEEKVAVVVAVLNGCKVATVAKAIGVSDATIWNWKNKYETEAIMAKNRGAKGYDVSIPIAVPETERVTEPDEEPDGIKASDFAEPIDPEPVRDRRACADLSGLERYALTAWIERVRGEMPGGIPEPIEELLSMLGLV